MAQLLKYALYLQFGIWVYFLWDGAYNNIASGLFKRVGYRPITIPMVTGLIAFQLVRDLWQSKEFHSYYKNVRLNSKLRSLLVPVAKAYHYNYTKLRLIFQKLKVKVELDRRIDLMEK